jgi:hypothetical protein
MPNGVIIPNTPEPIIYRLLIALEAHHERQMAKLVELRERIRPLSRAQQISAGFPLQKSCPDFSTAKKLKAQYIMAQLDSGNGPVF